MDSAPTSEQYPLFRFGEFILCPQRRCVCRGREQIHLRGKVFKTLLLLVEKRGIIVTREQLLHEVWEDVSVVPSAIDHTIAEIRHALSDHSADPNLIETVEGQGYRFIAGVEKLPEGPLPCVAKDSMAVLPFMTLGLESGEKWLGMGLADAIITQISSLEDILILPTGAVSKYSGQTISPLEAGRQLQVNTILEGTIQRSGKRIRITLQLLRVPDGKSLWAETYDEKFQDAFSLEDSICQKVMQSLVPKLRRDRLI